MEGHFCLVSVLFLSLEENVKCDFVRNGRITLNYLSTL